MFDRSNIPMALVDRDRRYVAVNDAAAELYQYTREAIIGSRAGSGMPDEDPSIGDGEWETLVNTGELYSERVVQGSGRPMRVGYAAHPTSVDGRWLALFVVLSAHLEPEGEELIGSVSSPAGGQPPAGGQVDGPEAAARGPAAVSPAKRLTRREREIVQRVALGRSTPQIAGDLNLSPATVRSHVRNAMVKTGAHTRAQLVALVLGEGLANE